MAMSDGFPERKPASHDTLQVASSGGESASPLKSPASVPPTSTSLRDQNAASAAVPISTAQGASGLRIAAILFRTAFIFILMALVLRVSQPQNETFWTAYDTTDDLIRLWLGIGACVWLGWQLFTGGPKDVHGYRTWLYLGLTVVPFSLICLVAVW